MDNPDDVFYFNSTISDQYHYIEHPSDEEKLSSFSISRFFLYINSIKLYGYYPSVKFRLLNRVKGWMTCVNIKKSGNDLIISNGNETIILCINELKWMEIWSVEPMDN